MLEVKDNENLFNLTYPWQRAEFSLAVNKCTCIYLPPLNTKLVPICTDVVISLSDKTVNLPMVWAVCPHPGVHFKQMGGNWNGCLQMLQSSEMDSSHQANKRTDGGTVCL